ncbi:MAG: histidinol-phosphate transaminase [Eubacterium sp.]
MKQWEKNIRRVIPYVPGEQPKNKVIKLNTNESPYPPAPEVEKALEQFNADSLKLYPDPEATLLVDELADYYNVSPSQVFVGVGSDDVLAMAFMTFFNSDKPIIFPDITYSFYDVWADLFKIPYATKQLDDTWHINAGDYYCDNGGVVIANPNAPTGVYESLDKLEDIIKHNQDVIVIIDEAYIDFGGISALELIDKYENLLVVRTFSKSRAMAGMRIGFAIGNEELISAIKAVKYSYNSYTMNQPSIYIGVESVKADDYFKEIVQKIIITRENAKKQLSELGFSFTDSSTNFLFVTHADYSAKDIFEYLKTRNIYVRYFNLPRINNFLRITIGTDEEMQMLYTVLKEYMG